MTDLLGILGSQALPVSDVGSGTGGFSPPTFFPQPCEERFLDLLEALGLSDEQAHVVGVTRDCAPDIANSRMVGNSGKYLEMIANTAGGFVYVDHVLPRSPVIPERITFRGAEASVALAELVTFSSTDTNDPNTIPVVDVEASTEDAELINRIDYVNYSGVPLGSVVDSESVRKYGVRSQEKPGFYFAAGREWRSDEGDAPEGGVDAATEDVAPSNGNGNGDEDAGG